MQYSLTKVLLLGLLVPSLGVALANGSDPPVGDSSFFAAPLRIGKPYSRLAAYTPSCFIVKCHGGP